MGAENTWLETAWEDRTMPAQKRNPYYTGFLSYCSLAQSVEHAAVNRGVVSSSLTGAAKKKKPHQRCGFFFVYSRDALTEDIVFPQARWLLTGPSPTAAGGGRKEGEVGENKEGWSRAISTTMFSTVGVVRHTPFGDTVFPQALRRFSRADLPC